DVANPRMSIRKDDVSVETENGHMPKQCVSSQQSGPVLAALALQEFQHSIHGLCQAFCSYSGVNERILVLRPTSGSLKKSGDKLSAALRLCPVIHPGPPHPTPRMARGHKGKLNAQGRGGAPSGACFPLVQTLCVAR